MGTQGSVTFMFNRQGVIVIEREDVDEDQLMEDALEAGAADFEADGMVMEVRCEPDDFNTVVKALEDNIFLMDQLTTILDEDGADEVDDSATPNEVDTDTIIEKIAAAEAGANLPDVMPGPMFSSSPAAPILSAW